MNEKLQKITSDYVVVDVKKHRVSLAKHINDGGKLKVNLTVVLDSQESDNDGVSIEFAGTCKDVVINDIEVVPVNPELKKPKPKRIQICGASFKAT